MSFLRWFSKKPTPVNHLAVVGAARSSTGQSATALVPQASKSARPALDAGAASSPVIEEYRVKRHARREQLYVAIRESMTRAGMLSASYRFKVLSLDQNGNQFLVMMDVAQELGASAAKLSQTEEALVHTAKAVYAITVTAVYWRVDRKAAADPVASPVAAVSARQAAAVPVAAPAVVDDFEKTQANPPVVDVKRRHDSLLEEEVAAFKRALAAAPGTRVAAVTSVTAIALPVADAASKARNGSQSYTLMTGFEDTEIPDSPAMPALSATQYGELN
jgi:hypothetical protein